MQGEKQYVARPLQGGGGVGRHNECYDLSLESVHSLVKII